MKLNLKTKIFLGLIFGVVSSVFATEDLTGTTEVFGTASDGTILHWVAFTPTGAGPWPAVLVIHGGGFDGGLPDGSPELITCAQDLANAGYLAFSIEYRLAPPGLLAGQVSDGRFPDQTDDVKLAVRAARADPRCNGQVGAVGGSAGGSHTAFVAATGTIGEDRIDVGVSLSGAYDFTDFSPNPKLETFTAEVLNYVGVPATDTVTLRAASPAWQADGTIAPLYLVNTIEDSMPYSQLPDMFTRLDGNGVTNYQAITLPGNLHSFSNWSAVKDSALAFLATGFGAAPPPPSPTPSPSKQLLNVSTRAQVATGDKVMVGGFIINGDKAKRVVLRALGPSLAILGVAGTLSDPVLAIYDSDGYLVESNDNWILSGGLPTDLVPASNAESLLLAILPPGSYTGVLTGAGAATGTALFEMYDLEPAASHIVNVSTRGQAGTLDDVIIGGVIIGGPAPVNVIARALGPSLASVGVTGALPDPVMELHDSNGALLFANDNWRSNQEQEIIATNIPPPDDRESAIVATLPSGNYTALVHGAGSTTGVALVEVYDLENP
jgi:acetyl esterase/lipase